MVSLGYWNCSYTLLTTSHAVIYPMLRACLELILVHVYSASIPPSPAPLPQPPAQPPIDVLRAACMAFIFYV